MKQNCDNYYYFLKISPKVERINAIHINSQFNKDLGEPYDDDINKLNDSKTNSKK
jgi:hypothetical protein